MQTNRALKSSNWRSNDNAPTANREAPRPSHNEWNDREKQRRIRHVRERHAQPQREPAENTRIYMGNMPYMASRRDVEEVFERAGLQVVNIDISIDRFTNRNPSYCFIDLATTEAAATALRTLNDTNLLGRPLKINLCVQKRSYNDIRITRAQSNDLASTRWRSGTPATHVHKNTPSAGPDLLQPLRERRRLYIGGLRKPLDQHTSDNELRALFKDFGVEAVSKVQSPTSRANGTSQAVYYAFVDLSSAQEASRAVVYLHGMRKWGAELKVHVAKGVPEKVFERSIWESEEDLLAAVRRKGVAVGSIGGRNLRPA